MKRCIWARNDKVELAHYHDTEWGVPVHDDCLHFEMLTLEGAQAGLSWETVLKRREAYQKAFKNFDVKKLARLRDDELASLLINSNIIRHRLKIFSVRKNAQVFLSIQKEFGSFDAYVWGFVNQKAIQNHPKTHRDIKDCSKESNALSKDLKKRGMSFVGPTIIYAYMQAVGLVNDHTRDCDFGIKES
jgi:DNA-3-methyladenine glycosylase I